MTRYLLENTKTGAYIWFRSVAQAKRAAAHLGRSDFTITPTKTI